MESNYRKNLKLSLKAFIGKKDLVEVKGVGSSFF